MLVKNRTSSGEWDHRKENRLVRHIEWLEGITIPLAVQPVLRQLYTFVFLLLSNRNCSVELCKYPIHPPPCRWIWPPLRVRGIIISKNYWWKIERWLYKYDILIVTKGSPFSTSRLCAFHKWTFHSLLRQRRFHGTIEHFTHYPVSISRWIPSVALFTAESTTSIFLPVFSSSLLSVIL
jgi:hypothetical protein